jgi:hypothetical protein
MLGGTPYGPYAYQFAYHNGGVHTLTASGQFSIASPIGLLVVVTGVPAFLGRRFSTPDDIFDLGRLAVGTAAGWAPDTVLQHDHMLLVLPPIAWTLCGVTLIAGATATITELLLG